jgi:hypothetical protein
MHATVTNAIEQYVGGRVAYQERRGSSEAVLEPRAGGPTETGYPENPAGSKPAEAEEPAPTARAEVTP